MYESHFGLSGPPFQLNPDPAFYFDSRGHSHALSYLKFGAHQGEGFIVVTGEIGAGKTTLVRTLLDGLDPNAVVAAQIVSTQLESGDLLRAILAAFGVPVTHDSKAHLISTLEAFLTALAAQGKRALLIIDEAQNLPREAVEELRMLSNFQLGNHALLQSFLIGQPELRTLLKSKAMEQLRQRVIASCHLAPLDAAETRQYIEHRLKHVGWTGKPAFTAEAHEEIHQWTGGVPRRINRLCNRLLLGAFLFNAEEVTARLVNDTAAELRDEIGEPGDGLSAVSSSTVVPLPSAGRAGDGANVTLVSALPGTAAVVRRLAGGSSLPVGGLVGLVENRTDYFKLASLGQVLAQSADLPALTLVHTGTEESLAAGTVSDSVLPVQCPEVHLGIARADFVHVVGIATTRFDALLDELGAVAVLSIGSSDAVLACSLLAKKRGLSVFRIDAGSRRGEAHASEDFNSVLLDRLADSLFTTRMADLQSLHREGIAFERLQCTGSLVTNFLQLAHFDMRKRSEAIEIAKLPPERVRAGYALLSVRLPPASDADALIDQLLPLLRTLSMELPLVWPVRPWELAALKLGGHDHALEEARVMLVPDGGYLESLNLLRHAHCLVSGFERDLLEEAVAIGKRSLTIGAPDKMPQAALGNSNLLVGLNIDNAVRGMRAIVASQSIEFDPPEFWDGGAAIRIAEQLRRSIRLRPHRNSASGMELKR